MSRWLVGVFEHPRNRSVYLAAYVRDFNPEWTGCCVHTVEAPSGTEAKAIAMEEHRREHMAPHDGGRP